MNEQAAMMNQQQQQQLMSMNPSLLSMNQMNPQQPQPQMVPRNRSYGMWGQQQQFQNPNLNSGAMKPPPSAFNKSLGPRSNWKGKRVNKPIDKRRLEQQQQSLVSSGGMAGVNLIGGVGGGGISGSGSGGNLNFRNYNPPTLNELQHQNRLKARKFFPKKKFNKNINANVNMNMNMAGNGGRSAPFAPRNTTSFLIRAKKSGGIAPLVSPYPVTPSVLPTPILSPSTEVLGDMAKEEWGVDGYGSMKGLIRLRSHGHEMDEEEDEGGSSESDVEEHVEVERRLEHDLSRFEMIYDPNSVNVGGLDYHNVLENRVDDQDTHIAQLEEENLILKERLFLMERELGDLRRRMLSLERRGGRVDDGNEEVVENESENESESHGEDTHSNNEEFTGENNQEDRSENEKGDGADVDGQFADGFEGEGEAAEKFYVEGKLENGDEGMNVGDKENDNNDMNECIEAINVEAEDETAENGDDVSDIHVVETDSCMLEGEVNKEEKLGC